MRLAVVRGMEIDDEDKHYLKTLIYRRNIKKKWKTTLKAADSNPTMRKLNMESIENDTHKSSGE